MGTCNFNNQSDFDLWVIDNENDDDIDWFWDDVQENFNSLVKKDELMFHKLVLKGGYYSGAQIYVETIENPNELDNEDCYYHFDVCKSKAIRLYNAEIKRINKKVLPTFEQIGFYKINCVGVFSNGEAIYSLA